MFNTLKIKSEFDLEPVYASWKDAPKFNGNEKKDGTVRSWLDAIESGCKERKVPKAKWPELAQHYMGKKATARFYEVKKVMVHMHGVKYVWTWSKFTTAMTNMNWDLEGTTWFEIGDWSSNISSFFKGTSQEKPAAAPVPAQPTTQPFLSRSLKKKDDPPPDPSAKPARASSHQRERSSSLFPFAGSSTEERPKHPERAASMFSFTNPAPPERPKQHGRSASLFSFTNTAEPSSIKGTSKLSGSASASPKKNETKEQSKPKPKPNALTKPNKCDTRTAEVPVWLILACEALSKLNEEYPATMSLVSAILITVGSIPSLPAVSAGAAGAVLASGTAHMIGAAAVSAGGLIAAHKHATGKSGKS